jgi:hypothetical protein
MSSRVEVATSPSACLPDIATDRLNEQDHGNTRDDHDQD